MEIFQAVILGIVEGITEFLPISSTGHLILTNALLSITPSEFTKTFNIAIQLGAIGAVVVLYFKELLNIELLKRLSVAFIPTGIIGFTIYPFVKSHLLDSPVLIAVTLGLGGVVLIAFELWHKEHPEATTEVTEITYKQALFIGLFQSIAIIPGVSRSAATIIGGLWLGLSRPTIVAFSFLLAVPTMTAATGYDLLKNASQFSLNDFGVLAVGFITSFIVALAAIKWLLHYVRSHSFIAFGVYRICLAIIVLIIFVPIL